MRGSFRSGAHCIAVGATVIAAAACTSPGGSSSGDAAGGGAAVGAAGPYTCRYPLGSIVVVPSEPLAQQPDLPPVEPLIGVLARQSRCFFVAARGKAIEEAALRERQLSGTDGRGLAAADYSLATAITFVGKTGESKLGTLLGGANGASGARPLSNWSGLINQAAGTTFESSEANVVLTLVDNRTGFEVGAAQGSATARTTNLSGSLGALWGDDAGSGTASTYRKTPEAQLFSAAVMDGFKKLVASVEPELAYRGNGSAASTVPASINSGAGPDASDDDPDASADLVEGTSADDPTAVADAPAASADDGPAGADAF